MAELPERTLEYFDNDELRARVFYEKYALKDEDGNVIEEVPEEMWERVAREIASVENDFANQNKWECKFYDLMSDFKFVPGGRILFGAGQKRKSTLLNCYFIPIKNDSIEGIFDWCREAARTYSYGGGVGTDISVLRPKGSPVNNSAIYSTGAVSFMNIMSETTRTIGQNGRRGALMILIDVDHPDIFDFIDVKNDPERTSVRGANISVKITDDFMDAVRDDTIFDLTYNGEVYKTVKAWDIWEKLIKSAHASAEPGIIMWDNCIRYSPTEYNGMEIQGVNPCVTGDTRVYTEEGLIKIEDLVGNKIGLSLDDRVEGITRGHAVKIWSNGVKPVFQLETKEGYKIKCTEDHKIFTERGLVEAKDLVENDKIQVMNGEGQFGIFGSRELGEIIGYVTGDGWITGKKTCLGFWGEDRKITPYMLTKTRSFLDNTRYSLNSYALEKHDKEIIGSERLTQILKKYGFGKENKLEVPETVFRGTRQFQAGYLRGLFSADGTVYGNPADKGLSISLTSISKNLIDGVQMLLLNFGIASKQYKGQEERISKIKGELYKSKPTYRLIISKENLLLYANEIGFLEMSPKSMRLLNGFMDYGKRGPYKENYYARFKSLSYVGMEEVFDLTEPNSHSFVANGLTISNCSEQPLEDYGNCCLGNVNLSKYTKDGVVNYNELGKDLETATRFLDNVLDYNDEKHPLSQQSHASLYSRRIGVGFTGLGDMLIKLRIKYDSDEAVRFIDDLFNWIKTKVYYASIDLAKEKGVAPGFDVDKHFESSFIENLDEKLKGEIREHGLRNCCLLTVAPVGSGSILAGTTSGVEPIFALSYTRRSESLSKENYKVYHPLVEEYINDNLYEFENPEEHLPDIFVTAHDIEPMKRVEIQATIQKHIDSAISSTINLPEDVSIETVSDIYMKAWEEGCKGVTVYREGSRQGVLITNDKANESETSKPQPIKERPKILKGITEAIKTDKGTLYVTVNSSEGKPIEVFVQIGKSGLSKSADAEACGRLISLSLRSGVELDDIIKQLDSLSGESPVYSEGELIKSVPDAIAKVLRRIAGKPKKKSVVSYDSNCCDDPEIVNENGCSMCRNCGWAKC